MRGVALDEVLDTFHCPVLLDPACHSCISVVLVFVHLTPVRVKVAARVGPLNRMWVEYFSRTTTVQKRTASEKTITSKHWHVRDNLATCMRRFAGSKKH